MAKNKSGQEKCNLKDDWNTRNMWRWEKRQLILASGSGFALPGQTAHRMWIFDWLWTAWYIDWVDQSDIRPYYVMYKCLIHSFIHSFICTYGSCRAVLDLWIIGQTHGTCRWVFKGTGIVSRNKWVWYCQVESRVIIPRTCRSWVVRQLDDIKINKVVMIIW